MNTQLVFSHFTTLRGPRHRLSTSTLHCVFRRGVPLLAYLAMSATLAACGVRQSAHDEALQKIQFLQSANNTLEKALDTARSQNKRATLESSGSTNNRRLQIMLSRTVNKIQGQTGAWEVQYGNVPMMVMTSEQHDRMRIVAVVGDETLVKEADFSFLMQANFDRALDTRYALFKGKLWAVYLHPLSTLTETELMSALRQIVNLTKTYGTTYSSSPLQFRE